MAFAIPVAIFRQILLTSPTIIAFFAPAAPRIYGSPGIPRPDSQSMPQAAISLLQIGGTQNINIPIGDPIISVKCYGNDTLQAMQLYAEVDEVLGNIGSAGAPPAPPGVAGRRYQNQIVVIGLNSYYVYAIHKSAGEMHLMEPIEKWPYSYGSYMMKHWQIPV